MEIGDAPNKTSYFGFRATSELKTEKCSIQESSEKLVNNKQGEDSPYTPVSL